MAASTDNATVARLRGYIDEELRAAATYRALADQAEERPRRVLLQLAEGEERHAAQWAAALQRLGVTHDPPPRPLAVRDRLLSMLLRRGGVDAVVPLLERHEGAEIGRYTDEPHAPFGIVEEERAHARLLESLAPAWRTRASGALRAVVFGVSDGMVSNLALVMGVFGAATQPSTVVIAGVAGLLAGALSMAVGEYVSVASQREVIGGGPAGDLRLDDGTPDSVGSPIRAAVASLIAFTVGALIPLLPFLIGSGRAAAITAVGVTAVALYLVGAMISLLTLRPAWRSGLRQLSLGLCAAAATFLIGTLLGVAVA